MPEWDAEIEVGEALARRLIGTQYPRLDLTELCLLGEGWDNTVWVTGERIAFRFPRRAIALPGVVREMAVLPRLAAALPTRIPDAAYPGRPSFEFPWPWFGSHLVAGTEIALASRSASSPRPDTSRRTRGTCSCTVTSTNVTRSSRTPVGWPV